MGDVVKNQDSSISYETSLFWLDKENKNLLPKVGGIYVLWEDGRLYGGSTDNLFRRVPESIREQGFGKTIFYYPEKLLSYNGNIDLIALLRRIEAQCISAVFTITCGNGVPFVLTNEQHACPLQPSAWNMDEKGGHSLGIDIAHTVLHSLMVPKCLNLLPYYDLLFSEIPSKMRMENALRWNDIITLERDNRRKTGFQKGPLWCIKTD